MGQVRENSAEKNPLKKGKVAQFESDLLKANGDTWIALESHDIYRCLYGGGKFVLPTIQTYTFINVLGSFAKKLGNLLFSKTLLLDNHLLSAPVRVVALSNKLANRTGTFFQASKGKHNVDVECKTGVLAEGTSVSHSMPASYMALLA